MVSTVKSRPNHYEVLGLAPTASQEEIAAAFARSMSMFEARPVAVAAHIGVAFEVLRDPVKRRAYDRSLGLIGEDEPRQWTFVRQSWGPMIASASMSGPLAGEPHVTAQPEPQPQPQPETPAEPKVDLFAAPALRAPTPRPVPERQEAGLDDVIADILKNGREEKERLRETDRSWRDWNQPLFVVSGLLIAAGIIGGAAGLSVTHNEETAQAEPAVTVGLPEARKQAKVDAAPAEPVIAQRDPQPEFTMRTHVAKARAERMVAQPQLAPAPRPAVAAGETAAGSETLAEDPLAPQPATAQPVAASLPLSNAVIARTIERIGYRCGEVASTEAGAAPGVFKVTCSSGQTYQATPVHGRYRFRRSR
jgi:hypothetical protein